MIDSHKKRHEDAALHFLDKRKKKIEKAKDRLSKILREKERIMREREMTVSTAIKQHPQRVHPSTSSISVASSEKRKNTKNQMMNEHNSAKENVNGDNDVIDRDSFCLYGNDDDDDIGGCGIDGIDGSRKILIKQRKKQGAYSFFSYYFFPLHSPIGVVSPQYLLFGQL